MWPRTIAKFKQGIGGLRVTVPRKLDPQPEHVGNSPVTDPPMNQAGRTGASKMAKRIFMRQVALIAVEAGFWNTVPDANRKIASLASDLFECLEKELEK